MARRHLAVFLKGMAEKILSGEKHVEIRLSQSRIAPYGAVNKDDLIYLKISGGKIIGEAVVDNCLYYDNLDKKTLAKIREQYFQAVKMEEKFWTSHSKARFATILFLKNPKKFLTPVVYTKHDRRPWVVMKEEKCK